MPARGSGLLTTPQLGALARAGRRLKRHTAAIHNRIKLPYVSNYLTTDVSKKKDEKLEQIGAKYA